MRTQSRRTADYFYGVRALGFAWRVAGTVTVGLDVHEKDFIVVTDVEGEQYARAMAMKGLLAQAPEGDCLTLELTELESLGRVAIHG